MHSSKCHQVATDSDTLDFLISVDPQISIDNGKIGQNNKRRPSNKHRPWKIWQTQLSWVL